LYEDKIQDIDDYEITVTKIAPLFVPTYPTFLTTTNLSSSGEIRTTVLPNSEKNDVSIKFVLFL